MEKKIVIKKKKKIFGVTNFLGLKVRDNFVIVPLRQK